jgi:serine phosphatase RsbU (regulator of sigma subunit)
VGETAATDERSAITSSLADLDARAVTDELLGRLEQTLGVDEGAVLLLDGAGRQLVAYASRGLEEEVLQGTRVPLGRGFAGRVAAERRPIVIAEVGPDVVVNPLLLRKGLRTMLGVPMVASGRLVGVLHVGTREQREFSDDEIAVVQLAADRMAVTIVADRSISERHAARIMQRSLLPTRIPDVAGLEIATRFVAAESFGVGGDWYDAFPLPGGDLGFVIGDVAGHGLQAAVVMGRIRSVVRAYALEHHSPADVLQRVDAKFHHFEPDEMATLMYARLDADLGRMTIANAGHLPPVLMTADRGATLLDVPRDPPICVVPDLPRTDLTFDFDDGAVLVLYTDGLVERRDEPLDDRLDLLRRTLEPGSAEQIAAAVMDNLIGSRPVDDDTAVLVIARRGVSSGGSRGAEPPV